MALREQTLSSYSSSVQAPPSRAQDFAALLKTATAASALLLFILQSQASSHLSAEWDNKNTALSQRMVRVTEEKSLGPQLISLDATNTLFAASDVFNILQNLETAHPSMAAQVADARAFATALPPELVAPQISTDGEGEILFEWIKDERHAAVTFEGDGEFGYAMRRGSRFVPGAQTGKCADRLPIDLLRYLAEI